jgi:hypothetical protein
LGEKAFITSKKQKMRTKIALLALAGVLAVGIRWHLSGHCPLHHSGSGTAAKDAKPAMIAKQ